MRQSMTFPETLNRRYTFVQSLGYGGEAKVAKYKDTKDNKFVAVKLYYQFDEADSDSIKEFKLLSQFSHPHIVHVYDFINDHGVVYIIMQYVQGVTLDKISDEQQLITDDIFEPNSRFLRQEILDKIVIQLVVTLFFLHSQNIIYRDLKLENIIFNTRSESVTLIDFGSSKEEAFDPATTFVGTLQMMSPEQINGAKYTQKADIWALGVSIYRLMTGQLPFDGKYMIQEIEQGMVVFPDYVDDFHRSLIASCLKPNEDERWSAEQILLGFYPLEKETLVIEIHEVLRSSSSYKIVCFNAFGRIKSYKTIANNCETELLTVLYDLDATKTLPTPSFFRNLRGAFFYLRDDFDVRVAELLLSNQLAEVEDIYVYYEYDSLQRIVCKEGVHELFDGSFEEQILLNLNLRFPGEECISGEEIDLESGLRAVKHGCC